MSDDLLFFNADGPVDSRKSRASTAVQNTIVIQRKPEDDFSAPAMIPGTIYYLTITTPHSDVWTYHGPASTFAALLPLITREIYPYPTALCKWKKLIRKCEKEDQEDVWVDDGWHNLVLQEKGPTFGERGFTTFVVEHEQGGYDIAGEYTILNIVREINGNVHSVLPGPVFTLTSHGPLHHDMGTSEFRPHSGRPKGRVANSRIVGSYNEGSAAKVAAHRVMDRLLKDEAGVRCTEKWEGLGTGKGKTMGKNRGVGRGLLMAFGAKGMWEVKVDYEDDVLAGAMQRFNSGEENKLRGREANWRLK